MPKLNDRVQENRFIALFVGRSGSGKTVAEASFDKPMHIDDFEGRIGGAQNLDWQGTDGIDYDYWPPKMPNFISKINEKLESYRAANIMGQFELKTWICDSITNMTQSFVAQSLGLTHQFPAPGKEKRGRYVGPIAMPGPEDYGLEAQATYDYTNFVKSLPFNNVIFSAHLIQEWGKSDPEDPYSANAVIGELLSCRPKIGENIQTHFDHIFKFERLTEGGQEKFYVTFRGGIARSSYSWLPTGRHDWTRKPFKSFMESFSKSTKEKHTDVVTISSK